MGGSSEKTAGPNARFYFEDIDIGQRPAPEAAFLAHSGWAEAAFNATRDGGGYGTSSGGLGFRSALRWVGKSTPVTVTIPLMTQAFWFPDDGDDAVLKYFGAGAEIGYYVRPDTEIAVSATYMWASLFTSTSGASYDYIGWDLRLLTARAKSVLDLGDGRWLSLEPSVSVLTMQLDGELYGVALDARYYITPSLGIGPRLGYSTFSGPHDVWADYLRMMATRSVGVTAAVSLGWRWGIVGAVVYRSPEDSSVDSRTMASVEAVARF